MDTLTYETLRPPRTAERNHVAHLFPPQDGYHPFREALCEQEFLQEDLAGVKLPVTVCYRCRKAAGLL
jgi:hypothetical protein